MFLTYATSSLYQMGLCTCERGCVSSLCVLNTRRGFFFVCPFQSCSECAEPTLAQSLCTLCNKWLCYQCTDVHQHQRASNASQYADMHQQQRPSAAQCPDLHQRGSSSLPPTGQGKIFTYFKTLLHPFSRPVWQIISGAAQSASLCHLKDCFGFFVFPLVLCLFANHVSVGKIAMNNAWSVAMVDNSSWRSLCFIAPLFNTWPRF